MKVKIYRLDDFGRGITYVNDKVCFVENALPDEIVEITITKEYKKYLEAKVLKYLDHSPNRVESKCPYFQECGGCNLWHIGFNNENRYKQEKIKNLLKKFTILQDINVSDTIYQEELGYRNKLTLHGKNKKLGLYKKETNDVIEIDKCLIANHKINTIIKELMNINKNISKVVIKTSNNQKYCLVEIKGEVKSTTSLEKIVDILIVNNQLLTKESSIMTTIGNKKYYQSSSSFFQINAFLTKYLYDEVLSTIKEIKPSKVLDLYCGVGTIGIYISDYCQEVIAIDYNESNILDANKNKILNNSQNISFICDKVENQINNFTDIDAIIIDPPRKGLDLKTKKYINKLKPKTVIYISCDPVTLTRDLNDLSLIYNIKYIKPFNMFPKTYHVECVCVLSRR